MLLKILPILQVTQDVSYSFNLSDHIIPILISAFLSILFLESSLDKFFNWKGNLNFLMQHFEETSLREMVPLMLTVVSLVEFAAGVMSFLGMVQIVVYHNLVFAFWGAVISALAILMLFFGQRVAKDYNGASTLAIYFIVTLISLALLGQSIG
jgi:hypothetical protein